jgi:tRNA-specific 2-thiouridylase
MKRTIAVAMSRGVDSLVAAHLLKARGHRVFGIHFLTGYEGGDRRLPPDREAARDRIGPVAEQIGIDLIFLDVADAFENEVVAYFTDAYRSGRTPNPCLRCNPRIKFGTVLAEARRLGADQLATGHYARVSADDSGIRRLHRGIDSSKDQSYFLGFMTREQLAFARFPLGGLTKEAVRRLARQEKLRPAADKESQDVCFIPDGRYGDFLAARPGFVARPGVIEDLHGKVLGRHPGLHLFTIGQRRGINCPAAEPYYVVRIDRRGNRLVVGPGDSLRRRACRVRDVNWIAGAPGGPVEGLVRLRYRHRPVAAAVTPTAAGGADVRFASPQKAVTPGQGAVFYRGDEVLGAGWICGKRESGDGKAELDSV